MLPEELADCGIGGYHRPSRGFVYLRVLQIDTILAACSHKDITRALFSATLPDKVEQLAR